MTRSITKRSFFLLLAVVALLSLFSMGAYAADIDVVVYNNSAGTQQIYSDTVTIGTTSAKDALDAAAADGDFDIVYSGSSISSIEGVTATSGTSGWLYYINDEYQNTIFGNATVADGDKLVVFFASNTATEMYGYLDVMGATVDANGVIQAVAGETIYVKPMMVNLNYSNLYTDALAVSAVSAGFTLSAATNGVYPITVPTTVNDYTLTITQPNGVITPLKLAVEVSTVPSPADKTALAALITAAGAYTPANYTNGAALTAALSNANTVYNNAGATQTQVNSAYNRLNSTIENLQSVNDNSLKQMGIPAGIYFNDDEYFKPSDLTYSITTSSSATSLLIGPIVTANSAATLSAEINNVAATISGGYLTVNMSSGNTYVVEIMVATSGGRSLTYTVTIIVPSAVAGINVNGYLPGVSQYAGGTSYGSISTDNLNSLLNASLIKTIGSNAGSLVSLGSSGYIQYELDTAITNNVLNPYGIDFIVYGNAFSGNPEAGIVRVATKDPETGMPDQWYELGGSRYYESGTVRDTTVTYTKNASNIEVTYGGNTTTFTTTTAWWPLYAAKPTGENYGHSSGISGGKIIGGISYPNTDTTLTYYNRTVVEDTNTNSDYQFGYVDTHVNGSSYGSAVNPYTIATGGSGGDGFDLAWAVDQYGNSVDLTGEAIYFVQVYTGTVFNAGIFGETSTEVARMDVTTNTAGSDVGTTATPTVTVGGSAVTPALVGATAPEVEITADTPTNVVVTSSANYKVYINITPGTTTATKAYTLGSGEEQIVRIVAQNGTARPYIGYLKLVGVE